MLSVNEINRSHVEGRILYNIVMELAEKSEHKQPDLIVRELYKKLPKAEQGGTVVPAPPLRKKTETKKSTTKNKATGKK